MYIYYVYAYINKKTGLPYYIGKGKGDRAFVKHIRAKVPKDKSKIIFLEKNLSEIGAYALERRYIRWYGKKIDNTGILINIADGGEGNCGPKGNWFNDGKNNIQCFGDPPEGFEPGMKTENFNWFNNGKITIRKSHCPRGFVPGRLKIDKPALLFYNNGKESIRCSGTPPKGFKPGRLKFTGPKFKWYNNGLKNIKIYENASIEEGFVSGRLPNKKKGG